MKIESIHVTGSDFQLYRISASGARESILMVLVSGEVYFYKSIEENFLTSFFGISDAEIETRRKEKIPETSDTVTGGK